jgi:hypothetical protein
MIADIGAEIDPSDRIADTLDGAKAALAKRYEQIR